MKTCTALVAELPYLEEEHSHTAIWIQQEKKKNYLNQCKYLFHTQAELGIFLAFFAFLSPQPTAFYFLQQSSKDVFFLMHIGSTLKSAELLK